MPEAARGLALSLVCCPFSFSCASPCVRSPPASSRGLPTCTPSHRAQESLLLIALDRIRCGTVAVHARRGQGARYHRVARALGHEQHATAQGLPQTDRWNIVRGIRVLLGRLPQRRCKHPQVGFTRPVRAPSPRVATGPLPVLGGEPWADRRVFLLYLSHLQLQATRHARHSAGFLSLLHFVRHVVGAASVTVEHCAWNFARGS